jgi:hypothetical protein
MEDELCVIPELEDHLYAGNTTLISCAGLSMLDKFFQLGVVLCVGKQ